MNPEQLKKALDAIEAGDSAAALEILKAMIASAASDGSAPAPEAAAAAESPDPPPDEETVAAVAASRELMRVTGTKTPGEATAALATVYASVKTLEADRVSLDLSERQGLVAKLIAAGVETPATAWDGADDAARAKRQPKKRLMDEPIAELRERVKVVSASKGGHMPPPAEGETPAPRAPRPLKREEIAACKRLGITPEEFQARKAAAVRVKRS